MREGASGARARAVTPRAAGGAAAARARAHLVPLPVPLGARLVRGGDDGRGGADDAGVEDGAKEHAQHGRAHFVGAHGRHGPVGHGEHLRLHDPHRPQVLLGGRRGGEAVERHPRVGGEGARVNLRPARDEEVEAGVEVQPEDEHDDELEDFDKSVGQPLLEPAEEAEEVVQVQQPEQAHELEDADELRRLQRRVVVAFQREHDVVKRHGAQKVDDKPRAQVVALDARAVDDEHVVFVVVRRVEVQRAVGDEEDVDEDLEHKQRVGVVELLRQERNLERQRQRHPDDDQHAQRLPQNAERLVRVDQQARASAGGRR